MTIRKIYKEVREGSIMIITPINELETRIVSTPEFRDSIGYSYPHNSRPEKTVGEHVQHQLMYIDFLDFTERDKLRLISLLHDFGKYRSYVEKRNHAKISEDFARRFINDREVLETIKWHDYYYYFFRRKNKVFDLNQFKALYRSINLDIMTKFNYVDSCDRNKKPIIWFEDLCNDIGIKQSKIYVSNPRVLMFLKDIK